MELKIMKDGYRIYNIEQKREKKSKEVTTEPIKDDDDDIPRVTKKRRLVMKRGKFNPLNW